MKVGLEEMTIVNEKTKNQLLAYLERISSFPNFNPNMYVQVYVTSQIDFAVFEACDYRLCFMSPDHKLREVKASVFTLDAVPFSDFLCAVRALY